MTDRLTGVLLLVLAMAFGIAGSGFESDFITDPLGPSAFPVMLAVVLAFFSVFLLFKPDPEPAWPGLGQWGRQIVTLAGMVSYGIVLEFIGFPIASVLLVAFLALMLGAKPVRAVLTGIGASVVLYFLFNNFLGLPLPLGEIFGG